MKQNTDYSILDEDFNIQELLYTLKSLKNTAPGQDNISNEIIKHFCWIFTTSHGNMEWFQIIGS